MRKFVLCARCPCSYLLPIPQLLTVGVQIPFRNYADKKEKDATPEKKVSRIREYLKEKKMQQIRELRVMRKELIKTRKELEKKLNKPQKIRSGYRLHVLKAVYSIKINPSGSRIRLNPRNEEVQAMPCHEHLRSFTKDVRSQEQRKTTKLTSENFAEQADESKNTKGSSVKIGFSFRADGKPVLRFKGQKTVKQQLRLLEKPEDCFVKQAQAISNSSTCNNEDNPRTDVVASSSFKKSLVEDLMVLPISKLKPCDMPSKMLRSQSYDGLERVRSSKLKKITFTTGCGLPIHAKETVPASVLDNIEVSRQRSKASFYVSDPSLRRLLLEIAQYRMASAILKALLDQQSMKTECPFKKSQGVSDAQSDDESNAEVPDN